MSTVVEPGRSTVPASRLPGGQPPRRGAQVALGVLALLGAVVLVAGVPAFLLTAFGLPVPPSAPSVEWLTRPITSETVLAVLVAIVWVAWAHFVVCLLVEAGAEVRHRGAAPRIPGGGLGTQALARRIVTAVVLLAGISAVGAAPALAVATPRADVPSTSRATAAAPAVAAQATAPRAHRTPARPAVDDLQRATRADVREGVTTYYDVKPPQGRHYDTLWDIAERFLGSGLRYKEIWELNKDVVQPDGRTLKDADLIYPGWVMKLPSDAQGRGLKVVEHAVPRTPGAPAAPVPGAATPSDSQDTATAGDASTSFDARLVDDELAPWLGVGGGLALAGVALAVRRRRAQAGFGELWAARLGLAGAGAGPDGGPGDDSGGGPGGPGGPGARAAGLDAAADVSTATWLAAGLRAWGTGGPVPAPTAVSLAGGGVAVAFAEEPQRPAPHGWNEAGPKVWTLERGAHVDGEGPAPLPGLVVVGRRDDGSAALVDLESVAGVVALEGDAGVRDLAASIALDTATHPWADARTVTMVGFAEDFSDVAPSRVRHTRDLARALESLENHAAYQRAACRRAGVAGVREARATAPAANPWSYHLVVCSGVPAEEELARLGALAADPQVSLGVVVVGPVRDAALRLTLREDGRLVSPLHGIDVRPQLLGVEAVRSLAELSLLPEADRAVSLDLVVEALESEQHASVVESATVRIGVLGPVTVEATGPVEPERVEFLTELACLLALNPQGLHVNRVAAALWPRGVEDAVRDAALAQLGAWCGTTADGAPVLLEEAGVWRFQAGTVSLDWHRLRATLNRVHDARAGQEALLREALGLVRGESFADVRTGRYAWLGATTLRTDIALVVGLTAQALAEHAADRGDVAAAEAALARGLDLLPANEDLWRSRLLLARRSGGRAQVEQVATELYAALAEHGSAVGASPQTDALVDELLPGWRRESDVA